jgi:cytosine/adenosine deaminase-related metal-dependent hydrolase
MAARKLLRGGTVISMDAAVGDFRRGDVLIEDGRIAAVAAEVEVEVGDCEVIDTTGMIVMPGLIDPHRHFWYSGVRAWGMDSVFADMIAGLWPKLASHYTAADLYVCNRAGIVEALDQGITTVFDWCHLINSADHAREGLRAHLELPNRAVFAVGGSMSKKLAEFEGEVETEDSWAPAREIREGPLAATDLVTMALAVQGPETTPMDVTRTDVEVARRLEIPISMHIDVLAGARPSRGIAAMHEKGLLAGDMQFVHCCGTGDAEFAMVAAADGRVAVTPMAEIALGFGEPPIVRMREAGLKPSVGADAVCAASGDQFDEARLGLHSQRLAAIQKRVAGGDAVDHFSQLDFTTREALEMITINAAHACWLEDEIGSLTPGKAADVIALRAGDLNLAPTSDVVRTLVGNAHGGNVDTVIVAGEIVKRDGALVSIDTAAIAAELAATRDRIHAIENPEGIAPPA